MFNKEQFIASFPRTLARLTRVEKMSKDILMPLSRDLLFMLHGDKDNAGDIGYINRTIAALSPANRKVFVLYLKEFTGFICNDDGTAFLKKSKQHYDGVRVVCLEWLADPMNNFYSWVNRQKIVNEKPKFTLEEVTLSVARMLKKADDAQLGHDDVLAAMFKGGLTIQNLIGALDKMGQVGEVFAIIEDEFQEAPVQKA